MKRSTRGWAMALTGRGGADSLRRLVLAGHPAARARGRRSCERWPGARPPPPPSGWPPTWPSASRSWTTTRATAPTSTTGASTCLARRGLRRPAGAPLAAGQGQAPQADRGPLPDRPARPASSAPSPGSIVQRIEFSDPTAGGSRAAIPDGRRAAPVHASLVPAAADARRPAPASSPTPARPTRPRR